MLLFGECSNIQARRKLHNFSAIEGLQQVSDQTVIYKCDAWNVRQNTCHVGGLERKQTAGTVMLTDRTFVCCYNDLCFVFLFSAEVLTLVLNTAKRKKKNLILQFCK